MKTFIKILEYVLTFGMGLAIYMVFFKPLFPIFTLTQINLNPRFCNVITNISEFFICFISFSIAEIIFYLNFILFITFKHLLNNSE